MQEQCYYSTWQLQYYLYYFITHYVFSIHVFIQHISIQLILPDSLRGRVYHSTDVLTAHENKRSLLNFGGIYDADTIVADTTLVDIGRWH